MRTRAILFDIDGTLEDSNDLHVTAWQEVFRRHGFEFDRETIHRQVGKGGDNLVPALAPEAEEDVQKAMREEHGELFKREYLPKVCPFPCARELLERTKEAGIIVVLASSASAAELESHMEKLGAADLVDATTSKDDVDSSKPDPDIFRSALGKLDGVGPEETLVIGDTPYDMAAARRCGIPAIGVRSGGFSDEALRESGASAVFEDVGEILDRFDELFLSEARTAD